MIIISPQVSVVNPIKGQEKPQQGRTLPRLGHQEFFNISQKQRVLGNYRPLFLLLYLVTLFDAFVSWLVIGKMGLAQEMNTTLLYMFQHIGVGSTMVLRAVWGCFLVYLLAQVFVRAKPGRMFNFTKRCSQFITVVFTCLLAYHAVAHFVAVSIPGY